MALKNLLGLRSFPITDGEIMRKIHDARAKQIEEIEISTPEGIVKLKLGKISYEGMMRDSFNHINYSK